MKREQIITEALENTVRLYLKKYNISDIITLYG